MLTPVARADFRRHLVPAGLAPISEKFVVVDDRINQGLPHMITLTADLSLLLVVPTGLATFWRDASPTAVVTSSRAELDPQRLRPPGNSDNGNSDGRRSSAPARLVVLRAGTLAGAMPLAAGARTVVPEADPSPGIRIETMVREWDIRAGSLHGPGDVGSRIIVAWRRVDQGATALEGQATR
ncbi:hypothetical protein [Nocardia xishanensis]